MSDSELESPRAPEPRIRRAAPDDAELIHRFVCELAAYEREPDAVETTPAVIRAQLQAEHPPFECVIAELAGEAAGFALFFHNYSTWRGRRGVYLEDLYVPERFRRHGVGQALLRAVARIALERACGRLEWAVLDWNRPAIDFYERLGAQALGDWTIYRVTGAALAALGAPAGVAESDRSR
jgi:GNAT superfamily N-acetyltransferase